MATRAAFGAEAYRTERKVDVVDNNKQVIEWRLVPIDCFSDRGPAESHVGARLEEHDFFSPVKSLDQIRAKAIPSFTGGKTAGKLVHNHKPQVVPRCGVLQAQVPQPHHNLHKQDTSQAKKAPPRCYTRAAILPRRLILDALSTNFSQRGCTSHVWNRLPGNVRRPGCGPGYLRAETAS